MSCAYNKYKAVYKYHYPMILFEAKTNITLHSHAAVQYILKYLTTRFRAYMKIHARFSKAQYKKLVNKLNFIIQNIMCTEAVQEYMQ